MASAVGGFDIATNLSVLSLGQENSCPEIDPEILGMMHAHGGIDALRGPYGEELLGDAMAYGVNDATIQFLLEGGADGRKRLSEAVSRDRPGVVEMLVAHGADCNAQLNGVTPLIQAVQTGRAKVVETLLLKCLAEPNACEGFDPWVEAIKARDVAMIQTLIASGIPLSVPPDGVPLISVAVGTGNIQIVTLLLDTGKIELNVGQSNPFAVAIRLGYDEIADLLFTRGADPNYKDPLNENYCSTLYAAMDAEHIDRIQRLIDVYKVDINDCDAEGESPLVYAMSKGLSDVIPVLLAAGADEACAEEILRRKFLAHMWWIRGTSEIIDRAGKQHTIRLEGFHSPAVMKKIADYFELFSSRNPSEGDSIVLDALGQTRCNTDSADMRVKLRPLGSLDPEQPVILMGGSKSHAISMVLFRGQFHLSNRGAGRHPDHAIQIFHIHKKIDIGLLLGEYDSSALFNEMIMGLVKKGIIEKIGGFQRPRHTGGNCTWVQGMGAVAILLRCLLGDQKGVARYVAFAQFCCYEELYRCELSPNPDDNLIRQVWEKASAGDEPN